ncbi:MAG: sulfatase-like hydrolase/transferase [Phycisphaerae bacterium]|nr:sulfatase-like hydrolase/transferase [Phycisphaerae bacterium]
MTIRTSRAGHTTEQRGWPHNDGRVYLAGLATSVVATLCTSLLEFALLSRADPPCDVSWRIVLGNWGRVSMIHACSVLPLLLVMSLPVSLFLTRKRVRNPDAWHAACAVVIAGLLVGYGDIAQYEYLQVGPIKVVPWHVLAVTCSCVVAVFCAIRWIAGTRPAAWYRRTLNGTALAGVAIFLAAPLLVRGTPFAGPDTYRLPPSVRVDAGTRLIGPPNVLFVVMDTVRADRLTHYGNTRDTSPFLAELSAKGVTFDRALAAGSWTPPSHASMFTGLSLREHGVGEDLGRLDDRFETMAERASASGFQTVSFSCNPHIDTSHNFMQGFQARYPVWITHTRFRSFLHHWMQQLGVIWPAKWLEHDDGAAMTNCLVAEWIADRYDPTRPFLVFINYMEAHAPHRPPLSYCRQFLDAASVKRSYELDRQYDGILGADVETRYAQNSPWIAPEDVVIYQGLYDASIRYLDDRIRELFTLLEANGMLDNTVTVVVSDHGEGLGDHGIFEHRYSVYDMLVRVPLTICVPRHEGGPRRVREAVSTAALFDVVCTAVAADECPDAQALARVMVDRAAGRPVVSEKLQNTWRERRLALSQGANEKPGLLRLQACRSASDATMKYIIASDGTEELYDISTDPGEINNLAGQQPDSLECLSSSLTEWLARTPPFAPQSTPETAPKAVPTQAQMNLLKSLGYVGE